VEALENEEYDEQKYERILMNVVFVFSGKASVNYK
jgi:hypothetical protein